MIGVRLTVPIACWRKGQAREFLESQMIPPPATCYGSLLSLVGEPDPNRHRGCRVTASVIVNGMASVVLRTLWQVKNKTIPQGCGPNAGPDFQQLIVGTELAIWCDSEEERVPHRGLEIRVREALETPDRVQRFGGWSLGESTHLINDARLAPDMGFTEEHKVFLEDESGYLTLPVWVDHVGAAGTRYVVGRLEVLRGKPPVERIPQIPLSNGPSSPLPRRRRSGS